MRVCVRACWVQLVVAAAPAPRHCLDDPAALALFDCSAVDMRLRVRLLRLRLREGGCCRALQRGRGASQDRGGRLPRTLVHHLVEAVVAVVLLFHLDIRRLAILFDIRCSWHIFKRQQTTRGTPVTEHAETARGEVATRMRCVHAHCPICARHTRARAHAPIDNRPSDFAHRPVRIPRCDAAQHATQLRDIDLRFDRRLPWSVSPRSHSHVVDCVFGVVSTTHSIDCRRLTFLTDLHPQCVNLPICVDGVEGLAMCGQHYPHAHHLRVALVGVVQPDFVHLVRHFFQLNLATYVARQEDLPPCLRQVIIHVHVFLRFVW